MGGALIMKLSQRQAPGIVPAPIVSAAPVVAPPPAAGPPVVEPPAVAEPAPPVEPAPSPFPKKSAVVHVHHTNPPRAPVTMIAQNRPPALPSSASEPAVSEPRAPQALSETEPAPVEVPPPAVPLANAEPTDATASEPPPQVAPSVTLRAGMILPVRLGESLSSEHNQAGDTFTATLDTPLVADGFVIAERGARLEGRIIEAQKASHTKRIAGALTGADQAQHFRRATCRDSDRSISQAGRQFDRPECRYCRGGSRGGGDHRRHGWRR